MSRGGEFKSDLIYSGGSLSQTRHYYLNNQQAVEERLNTGTAADRQNVRGLAYVDQLVLRDRDTDANGSLDERLYACQDANFNLTGVMRTAGAVKRGA